MNEAKKKARELVASFKERSKEQIFYNWEYVHKYNALICVDNEIKTILNFQLNDDIGDYWFFDDKLKELEEVKQEIQKL